MGYFRFRVFLLCTALLWVPGPLRSQDAGPPADPSGLIGLTLEALLGEFGVPRSVYAVRGLEEWQDDVVFVYDQGDFYIYKDRVWQLGLKAAYDIKVGDSEAVVSLILGEGLRRFEGYVLFPLSGRNWPLILRLNLDGTGRVTAIFVYRSDF